MNTVTNNNQDKIYFRVVMTLSIVVFAAVVILNRKLIPRPDTTPDFVSFLPKFNAIINATCSLLLLVSLYFIKQKNIAAHKTTNIITFILSSAFLVSYVLFHYFIDNTLYPDNGFKTIYYAVLIPHIILAALVLPLILLSYSLIFLLSPLTLAILNSLAIKKSTIVPTPSPIPLFFKLK